MKLVFRLCIVYLCAFSIADAQQSSQFKIVGYYSLNAAMTEKNRAAFKRLTHINLWFLNPDSLGNFTRDLSALKPFVSAAHRRNIKILFSIGGGSNQSQYHALLQDGKRAMLIEHLISEVLKYDIDGVDVDLEGSNIDGNYEKFVVELASALRSHQKLITAAIAVYYKDQLTDAALAQYDFVNVMSYDRTGPWRPEKPGPHATLDHAIEDLDYFGTKRQIPAEKMTLGVPFYGYGYGPTLTSPAISMNFAKIVSSFSGSEEVDEWAMPEGKTIYYNGIPTIRKKTLLAMNKASGIMIWQVLGDAKGKKSLLKAIHMTAQSTKKP